MKIKREDIRNVAIIAHVDHGKTTLVDQLLKQSGVFRENQQVQDRVMDSGDLERERGITIFSKQAVFSLGDTSVTLLDTPGHVDFSAEMERTLQVLDYAILVINGADGVQGHTETLWRLLKRYHIPVFLFVNKMDQPGTDKETLLANIRRRLDGAVVDFGDVEIDGSTGALVYTGDEEPEALTALNDIGTALYAFRHQVRQLQEAHRREMMRSANAQNPL